MLRLSEILRLTQDDKYRKFILIAIMSDMYYREPICTTVTPDIRHRESIPSCHARQLVSGIHL